MNSDENIEQALRKLGKQMAVSDAFKHNVLEQIQPRPMRFAAWWGGSLVAAAVLVLAFGMWMRFTRIAPTPMPQQAAVNPVTQLRPTLTRWRAVSERAVEFNGEIPAREIQQQDFDRLRWVDPQSHAVLDRVQPHSSTMLIEMESY